MLVYFSVSLASHFLSLWTDQRLSYWYQVLFTTFLRLLCSNPVVWGHNQGHIPYQGRDCFCYFVIHIFFIKTLAPNLWFGEKRGRQHKEHVGRRLLTTYTQTFPPKSVPVQYYNLGWTICSTLWSNQSSCLEFHFKNDYYDEKNTQTQSLYKQLETSWNLAFGAVTTSWREMSEKRPVVWRLPWVWKDQDQDQGLPRIFFSTPAETTRLVAYPVEETRLQTPRENQRWLILLPNSTKRKEQESNRKIIYTHIAIIFFFTRCGITDTWCWRTEFSGRIFI